MPDLRFLRVRHAKKLTNYWPKYARDFAEQRIWHFVKWTKSLHKFLDGLVLRYL